MDVTEKNERRLSVWYTIDRAFFLVLAPIMFFMSVAYFKYGLYISIAELIIAFALKFAKPLYYKDSPKNRAFKVTAAVMRTLLCTACIIALILPFLPMKSAWYYRVKRAVFLTHYNSGSAMHSFIIEEIPDNAEELDYYFSPKIMMGAAGVRVSFRADAEALDKLAEKAENIGGTLLEKGSDKLEWWTTKMKNGGIDISSADVYTFKINGALYIIDYTKGTFCLYY